MEKVYGGFMIETLAQVLMVVSVMLGIAIIWYEEIIK